MTNFFSARSETISSGNQLVGKLNRFWAQWAVFLGLPFWLFTHAESLLKHHGSILLGAQSDCKSKPESFQYQNSCPSNTDISIYRATNSKPDTEYKNFSRLRTNCGDIIYMKTTFYLRIQILYVQFISNLPTGGHVLCK